MKNSITLVGKYTKAEIFAKTVEDGVYTQVYDIINNPAFLGKKVVLMPDVHVGASGPCGLVAEIGDWICPEHIGVDIGCSVTMMMLDGFIPEDKLVLLEHRVKQAIPMGFNLHERTVIDEKDFFKFLGTEFMKARTLWPEVFDIEYLPNVVTEKWIDKQLKKLGMEPGVFYKSLGTIGGGNHFIEYGESKLNGAITMHFGSRNLGVKVCKYWMKKTANPMTKKEAQEVVTEFKKEWSRTHKSDMSGFNEALKKEMQERKKNFIKGYLTGEDMKGYLADMVFAQAYAKYNHKTVKDIISKILSKMHLPKIDKMITCTHNYIDFRDHYIRKSAISTHEGEEVIVPLNMRDGTVFGVGKGNECWMNSCSHGAGRKMSRSEAKKNITLEEFQESMQGIVTTSVDQTTIDESPMAYKDTDEIIDAIQDTIDILAVFIPKISWKSSEEC